MSVFMLLVLGISIAGFVWAAQSANVAASRAMLGLTGASAVLALFKLWTWDPDAVR